MRPNYFIFMGYIKTGGGEGGSSQPPKPPLHPPLQRFNFIFTQAQRNIYIENKNVNTLKLLTISFNICLVTQKDLKMGLLSRHNICLGYEIRFNFI